MPKTTINATHQAILEKSAIDKWSAQSVGIFSVEKASDLPRDLAWMKNHVPGLVFPLRGVNNQDVIFQIRADNPEEGTPKYLFPANSAPGLIVWGPMLDKLDGDYDSVMIVEGTKQSLAVSMLNPPADLVVVGIAGCWGWLSPKSGADAIGAVDGLSELVADKMVYVCFDADIASNQSVHNAAVQLNDVLTDFRARAVHWVQLGGSKDKIGLDDHLGRFNSPQERLAELKRLLRKAKDRIPTLRKTVPSQLPLGVVVDEDDMSIVEIGRPAKDGDEPSRRILLGCIPVVKDTTTIINDLVDERNAEGETRVKTLGAYLTLEVSSKALGDEPYQISIPYEDLPDTNKWIQQLPSGVAIDIVTPPRRSSDENKVVNAIKQHRTTERHYVTGVARLGWKMHQGQPCYLFSGGAIGPHGLVQDLRGILTGTAAKVAFRDPSSIKPDDLRTAVRASLVPISFLHKPGLWKLLVGAVAFSTAGFNPKGMLFIYGEPGSGKTHLAQGATAFLTTAFSPGREIMASLEGTDNAIISLSQGIHNSILLFDDVHPAKQQRKRDALSDLIDSLSRVGYSGGTAAKMRAGWDVKRQAVKLPIVTDNRPFIMITAEFQPYGDDARSQLERMFLVRVRHNDTFLSLAEAEGQLYEGFSKPMSGAHALEEIAMSGKLNDALGGFISWIANQMVEALPPAAEKTGVTPLDYWKGTYLDNLSKEILQDFQEDDTRLAENVRTYLVGWWLWLAYAHELGAVSTTEVKTLMDSFRLELREMADTYRNSSLRQIKHGFGQMIEEIQAMEVAGEIVILDRKVGGKPQRNPFVKQNAIVVGAYIGKRKNGQEGGVCLSIPLLAKALRKDTSHVATLLDHSDVIKSYLFRMNDRVTRGWFIPNTLWEASGEDQDPSVEYDYSTE